MGTDAAGAGVCGSSPRPSRFFLRGLLFLAAASLSLAGAVWAAPAQDRLVVGLKAYRDGFYGLAAKELRAFLEAAPDDPRRGELLFLVAQSEIARERWTEADEALKELAAAGGPRGREARYWLGWVAVKRGDGIGARRQLDAYLAEAGGDHRADALYLAGELALRAGDGAVAAERFASFLDLSRDDRRRPAVWADLVDARLAADRGKAALEAAGEALRDPGVRGDREARLTIALAGTRAARKAGEPSAEGRFWATVADAADTEDLRRRARVERGDALLRAGDLAGAQKSLEAAIAAKSGAEDARPQLLLAQVAERRGDRAGALARLGEALRHPRDPAVAPHLKELRLTALHLALNLGDGVAASEQARALLERETALGPEERALAHATLAAEADRSGDRAAALAHWEAVPPGTAGHREAVLQAAQTLLELDRPGDALSRIEPLLAADDPGGEAHLVALAAADGAGDRRRVAALSAYLAAHPPAGRTPDEFLYRRAVALGEVGDAGYPEALQALVERDPEGPRAGWAGLELERQARSVENWQEVLRWAPAARRSDQPDLAAFWEAEALRNLGHPDQARQVLEPLAAGSGAYRAPALAQLGALRDEAGEGAIAARLYREALDAGLDSAAAEWVRDRLDALGDGTGGATE